MFCFDFVEVLLSQFFRLGFVTLFGLHGCSNVVVFVS